MPDMCESLEALIRELDQVSDDASLNVYMPKLRSFMLKLELQTQQEGRLVSGLTNLLRLLLDNVAEINRSDDYLVGQVHSLQEVLSHQPLSMQQVYQLETSLKAALQEIGRLRDELGQAQQAQQGVALPVCPQGTGALQDLVRQWQQQNKRQQPTQKVEGERWNQFMHQTSDDGVASP